MRVEVQKIPVKKSGVSHAEATLMAFCYEYQQYTYEEAKKLPYKRVKRMLKIAHRRQADYYYNMVKVVNGAMDGKAAKKLLSHYEGLADG